MLGTLSASPAILRYTDDLSKEFRAHQKLQSGLMPPSSLSTPPRLSEKHESGTVPIAPSATCRECILTELPAERQSRLWCVQTRHANCQKKKATGKQEMLSMIHPSCSFRTTDETASAANGKHHSGRCWQASYSDACSGTWRPFFCLLLLEAPL